MSKFWKARNVDPYDTDSDTAEYFGLVPTLPYGYSSRTIEHQQEDLKQRIPMRSSQSQSREMRWFIADFLQVPFSRFSLAVGKSVNYINGMIHGARVPAVFINELEERFGLDMGFIFYADKERPGPSGNADAIAADIRSELGLSDVKRHHHTKSSLAEQEDAVEEEETEEDDEDFVSWELKNGINIEIAGPPDILGPVRNAIKDGLLRITLSYRENLSL